MNNEADVKNITLPMLPESVFDVFDPDEIKNKGILHSPCARNNRLKYKRLPVGQPHNNLQTILSP